MQRFPFGSVLVVACCGLVGACAAPNTAYDLSSLPATASSSLARRVQIVLPLPVAVQILESERILVRSSNGSVFYLSGGQWVDLLPRLLQTRLIQSFEDGLKASYVSRPGERVVADYQLMIDIRAFEISSETGEAVIELSARLIADRTGRIVKAQIFSARAQVGSINAENAALALNDALAKVTHDMILWIGG